jgi:hypothetical protein
MHEDDRIMLQSVMDLMARVRREGQAYELNLRNLGYDRAVAAEDPMRLERLRQVLRTSWQLDLRDLLGQPVRALSRPPSVVLRFGHTTLRRPKRVLLVVRVDEWTGRRSLWLEPL